MRRISLNARLAHDAATTTETEVHLLQFEHASLAAPIRLSTDPTEVISTDPKMYGTVSTWNGGSKSAPYQFVLASTGVPGEGEDGTIPANIVIENVDRRIAEILRSFTDRATCHMATVLASSPDVIEAEYRDYRLIAAEGDAAEITLEISRQPIEDETVPMDRFTPARFPGLFR